MGFHLFQLSGLCEREPVPILSGRYNGNNSRGLTIVGEFDYIEWLRRRTPGDPRVLLGPGDDCAVLAGTALPWLITTDMLLEGSHFCLAEAGPHRVGRKAMAVNLSDIAAMAGRPVAAVVSVGLPRQGANQIAEGVYEGMRAVADAFDTALVGGDTNTWDEGLVVSVTLLGQPTPPGPVRRAGARPGDWLLVTGPLGGSLLGKHLDFTPRVREAMLLQQSAGLHAMIDISDGLAADAYHLCEESGCGAVLRAEAVPVSAATAQMTDGRPPLAHALSDGEDFELALAVSAEDGRRLVKTQPIPGITLVHVGEFSADRQYLLEENGRRRPLEPRGFEHRFQ
jgi:thiamine-monophosphate kinase